MNSKFLYEKLCEFKATRGINPNGIRINMLHIVNFPDYQSSMIYQSQNRAAWCLFYMVDLEFVTNSSFEPGSIYMSIPHPNKMLYWVQIWKDIQCDNTHNHLWMPYEGLIQKYDFCDCGEKRYG